MVDSSSFVSRQEIEDMAKNHCDAACVKTSIRSTLFQREVCCCYNSTLQCPS